MDAKQLWGVGLLSCVAIIIVGMLIDMVGWRVTLLILTAAGILTAAIVFGIMLVTGEI